MSEAVVPLEMYHKAQTEIAELRRQIRVLQSQIETARLENDRLSAIINRLPKTKDGVVVIPGIDRAWVKWCDGWHQTAVRWEGTQAS